MDFTNLIKAIHIRSNYGPDIDIPNPFAPAPPNAALEALQPMIVLETDAGPVSVAPYGTPGPTQWGTALAGLGGLGIFILVLAGYGGYKLLTNR
jgi:hypothetical protein